MSFEVRKYSDLEEPVRLQLPLAQGQTWPYSQEVHDCSFQTHREGPQLAVGIKVPEEFTLQDLEVSRTLPEQELVCQEFRLHQPDFS